MNQMALNFAQKQNNVLSIKDISPEMNRKVTFQLNISTNNNNQYQLSQSSSMNYHMI
jgi:hypothetical protein